ncbi:MAG: M23 family metallopeptidase [Holosporaceae bacterium]|jgi:murein DD-endopeptidase MepM/ murein hydrolase activator NlpD|nr:M23 family metallopeptidase [Holosporaceae bacterium]
MVKFLRFQLIIVVIVLLACSCSRESPSPVEIRLDSDTDVIIAQDPTTFGGFATHRVSGNETLYDVAYRYNIDPSNLASINGVKAPYKVQRGQVLQLPNNDAIENPAAITIVSSGSLTQPSVDEKNNSAKNKIENENTEAFIPDVDGSISASEPIPDLAKPKVVAPAVDITKLSTGKLMWPVNGKVISNFGDLIDGSPNDGINIKPSGDAKVKAADAGTIIYSGNKLEEEFGNVVIVQHDNGLITSYAHLSNAAVKDGDIVAAGDIIGQTGKSGNVSEPQLHFEVMKDKKPVNPLKFLEKQVASAPASKTR